MIDRPKKGASGQNQEQEKPFAEDNTDEAADHYAVNDFYAEEDNQNFGSPAESDESYQEDVPVQDGSFEEDGQEYEGEPGEENAEESASDEYADDSEEYAEGEVQADEETGEPVESRTFFQKYFTLIAVAIVLCVVGGIFYAQFGSVLTDPPGGQQLTPLPSVPLTLDSQQPSVPQPSAPSSFEPVPNTGTPGTVAPPVTEGSDPFKAAPQRPLITEKQPEPLGVFPEQPTQPATGNVPVVPVQETTAPISPPDAVFPAPSVNAPDSTTAGLLHEDLAVAKSEVSSLKNKLDAMDMNIQVLQQSVATLSQGVDTLKAQNTAPVGQAPDVALSDKIAQLNTDVENLKTQLTALAEKTSVTPAPVAAPSAPSVSEQTAVQNSPPPPKKTTSSTGRPPVASPWILRSATSGQAWVAHKTQGVQRRVVVGDVLIGLGRITDIYQDGISWVLEGTDGKIRSQK